MRVEIIKKTLKFKFHALTSRGGYDFRHIYLIVIHDGDKLAVGECAPLPHLSIDDLEDYEQILNRFAHDLEQGLMPDYEKMRAYPSMIFGFENALLHLKHQDLIFYRNAFTQGLQPITINGLVWMGSYELMSQRLNEKLAQGFKTIKIKIGAIDLEHELLLLKRIRQDFPADQLTIRTDANGAFAPDECLKILDKLAQYEIHSIEQPIRQGQTDKLAQICKLSPIPIALDEELIAHTAYQDKLELLHKVRPQYLVLKPSLHGGIIYTKEWIELAEQSGIGYWITSALESNIGLNLIAQFTASLNPVLPQGLGTGQLYFNNIDFPLYLDHEKLYFDPHKVNDIDWQSFINEA